MSSVINPTFASLPSAGAAVDGRVPPLENGDHLTRAEFMRRWEAMPNLKRAELIEGIVYMAAAVRHLHHGRPHRLLIGWLDRYISNTPGIDGGANASIGLDEDNMPQPDGYLLVPVEMGGLAQVTDDGYLEGAPTLVAEISASTSSMDLNQKFQVYLRSGVREYLVWRVRDNAIDWFVNTQGQFVPMSLDSDGIYRSRVCPGLWLDPEALIRGRSRRVYEVLDLGMATSGYRTFATEAAKYYKPDND
jgi:Uma2 family endonuclease